jgi:hypothetical protein
MRMRPTPHSRRANSRPRYGEPRAALAFSVARPPGGAGRKRSRPPAATYIPTAVRIKLENNTADSFDTVGKPIYGLAVEIFLEDGNVAPPGEMGEFAVECPSFARSLELSVRRFPGQYRNWHQVVLENRSRCALRSRSRGPAETNRPRIRRILSQS